jgi:hypothetical protein
MWGAFRPQIVKVGALSAPAQEILLKLPISTVIPIILLATVDTSFRKNGHKKTDFSRHEKSTNHF